MAGDRVRPELPDDLADRAAEQLLGLTGPARAAALAALVAACPEHAESLEQLCADLGGAERLLDTTYPETRDGPPTQVGGHRVIRQLGEGAFGIVFLCAQERPVVRTVAIKVLRPGAGDAKTLQRFAAERQLLASLNHPAITQVFDAGELPDGRPFFMMEYVDGLPLRSYCVARGLSCQSRLRLFMDVCRGVAHAHLRGIVHRDLKPANVLVVDTAEGPAPKIIDFGIAKALQSAPRGPEPRTDAGRVIGTPGYMSPEQASGRADEVDERADVFALGVMLYELLTDALPWAQGAAATETEPIRPSARVTTTTSRAAVAPAAPRRQLAAELRGDLDWITLKALARERADRYATVTALLRDIELHLAGQPVSVGPPAVSYRLRKLVRRHRGAFAWAAACAVTLLLGTVVAWQLLGKASTSDRARLAAVADAVSRLRQQAESASGDSVPDRVARKLLDDALILHDKELRGLPERADLGQLRLEVLTGLATSCWWLGEFRQAIRFGEEANQLAAELERGNPDAALVRQRAMALREIGRCHFRLREFEAARTASGAAIGVLDALYAQTPSIDAMVLSGTLVEYAAACGRLGDGERQLLAHERGLAVLQAFADAHPDDAEAQRNLVRLHCGLANMMIGRKEWVAAEAALQKAEVLVRTLPLVTDQERELVSYRLGKLYAANQQPALAVPHLERALQLSTSLLQRNPDRQQHRSNFVMTHGLLFEQQTRLGDDAAARVNADAVLVLPEGKSAEDRVDVVDVLVDMARPAIAASSLSGLAHADVLLGRATALIESARGSARARSVRVEVLSAHGEVLHQLGRPWPAARWDELAHEAQATAQHSRAAWARLQASRRRLSELDLDAARSDLNAARQAPEGVSRELIAHQALAIALAAQEHAAAARAARAMLAGTPSVTASIAAAIGYGRAAGLASRGAAADQHCAEDYAETARQVCGRVASTTAQSQAHEIARAQAAVCLAGLASDTGKATALRAASLPILDALRDHVPTSLWHEVLWCSGQVAAIRAELAAGRAAPALAALAQLVARPRSPADAVEVCALCLECAEPADGSASGEKGTLEQVEALALEALRLAVDGGVRGRERLLARQDLGRLRAHATFQSLVARVPE